MREYSRCETGGQGKMFDTKKTKGKNLVIIFPFGKCGNENSPPLFL
jgi:hypothetical protein